MRLLVIDHGGGVQGLPVSPLPFIHKPRIASAENITIETDPVQPGIVLTGTRFGTDGIGDTHVARRWQVSSDAAFVVIHHDTGEDPAWLVNILVTGLTPGQTYYARVQDRAQVLGLSDWSDGFSFVAP